MVLASLVVVSLARTDDAQAVPVELGDMDMATQRQRLQVSSASSNARVSTNTNRKLAVREARKAELKKALSAETELLGELQPHVQLEAMRAEKHVAQQKVSLEDLKSAHDAVDAMLMAAPSPEVPAPSNNPAKAKVQQEAANDQQKMLETLNHEKQELVEAQKMGSALKAEEEISPIEEQGFQSAIGITEEQALQVPYLSALDFAIKNALAKPTAAAVADAKEKLQMAAKEFQDAMVRGQQQAKQEMQAEAKQARQKQIDTAKADAEAAKKEMKSKSKMSQRELEKAEQFKERTQKKIEVQDKKSKAQQEKVKAREVLHKKSSFIMEIGEVKYEFMKEKVGGESVSSESIHSACSFVGMKPACASYAAYDGKCVPAANSKQDWSLAKSAEAAAQGLPEQALVGSWFYNGHLGFGLRNNGFKTQKNGSRMPKAPTRGNARSNKNGKAQVFCVKHTPKPAKQISFGEAGQFRGKVAEITGPVTNDALITACKNVKVKAPWSPDWLETKPVCDSEMIQSSKCIRLPESAGLTLSNPATLTGQDELAMAAEFAFFYGQEAPSLNYKTGTRSSTGLDAGGRTLCGTINPGWAQSHNKFKDPFYGHVMEKVTFQGDSNATNIKAACKAAGKVPVCASSDAFDGGCILASPTKAGWSYADPETLKNEAIDVTTFTGTYLYTGGNKRKTAAFNTGCCGARDAVSKEGGATWCAADGASGFQYGEHSITTVRVQGKMDSVAMVKACATKSMRPVCESGPMYFTGVGGCMPLEPLSGKGVWSLSNPSDLIAKNIDPYKTAGAFMYTGNETRLGRTLELTANMVGKSETFPANDPLFDGLVLCASNQGITRNFSIAGKAITLVDLPGDAATGVALLDACQGVGLQPVCNNDKVFNGMCAPVGELGSEKPWSMDVATDRAKHKVCEKCVKHTSIYDGPGKSKFITDKGFIPSMSGMATLCAEEYVPAGKTVTTIEGDQPKDWKMVAVKVKGEMTGPNAIAACQEHEAGYKPVCDSGEFGAGGLCQEVSKGTQDVNRFTYGTPTNKPTPPEIQTFGVFFYAGNGPMVYSNGISRQLAGRGSQRNGYTYCTQGASMAP